MCRHNSPQQLRFQPDYLRVTTDVIHKTGECYIGFSTNKPYCTHHKSTHGLFSNPNTCARQGNVSWIFSYCLISAPVSGRLRSPFRKLSDSSYAVLQSPLSDITGVQIQVLAFVFFIQQSFKAFESCTSPTWYHKKV